jgi:hypothetical protein
MVIPKQTDRLQLPMVILMRLVKLKQKDFRPMAMRKVKWTLKGLDWQKD